MALEYISLHVGQGVIASSLNDDGLNIIDTIPTIYKYTQLGEYEKHTALKGFRSYLHRYGKGASISACGKFALLCEKKCSKVLLFDLKSRKMANTFELEKDPDFTLFSSDGSYLAYANSVGRFVIYATQDTNQMYHQFALVDGVSCAVFSDDNTKIAIATLDKKVQIFDMQTKQIGEKYTFEDYIEGFSFSADTKTLVVYMRKGNNTVLNLALGKKYIADPSSEWPTFITHAKDSTVSLVGTRSNKLYVYTSANGNKIGTIDLEYWGVTSISLYEKKVFIGFSDGKAILIDNTQVLTDAQSALESKNYEHLCLLAFEYPLLFTHRELCTKLEEQYTQILEHKAQGHNEKIGYEALVSFLLSANISRQELLKSAYALPEIFDFMNSFADANIDQAFSIAYKVPLLRQLREFSEIRTKCFEELKKILHLLESNFEEYEHYLETMSSKYMHCTQGVILNLEMLGESYKQLLSSINAQNFAAVMDITERYPILRQTKAYQRIMNYGEAFIEKTLMMIKAGKMAEADRFATNLIKLKPFESTGKDFKRQIQSFTTFESACKSKNVAKIFSLIEEYPLLRTTDMYRNELLYYQEKVLNPAITQASSGQLKNMQQTLGAYLNLEQFTQKHFELYKFALLRELEKYMPLGQEQEMFDKYHSYFGWDKHYANACKAYECKVKPEVKLDEVSVEHKALETLLNGPRNTREVKAEQTTPEVQQGENNE